MIAVRTDPAGGAFDALRASVLDAPGAIDRVARAAVLGGDVTDARYQSYVDKVREASYRVTEADFAAMTATGLSEDAIFEITVAAAVGAAGRRLDAALRAMAAADGHGTTRVEG
jgi:hypothetical protein